MRSSRICREHVRIEGGEARRQDVRVAGVKSARSVGRPGHPLQDQAVLVGLEAADDRIDAAVAGPNTSSTLGLMAWVVGDGRGGCRN